MSGFRDEILRHGSDLASCSGELGGEDVVQIVQDIIVETNFLKQAFMVVKAHPYISGGVVVGGLVVGTGWWYRNEILFFLKNNLLIKKNKITYSIEPICYEEPFWEQVK